MRKLGLVLLTLALAGGSVLGLAACGSSGSSGKEGGTLTGTYASFPDYLDPQLSYTAEGWTAMLEHLHPAARPTPTPNGKAGSKVVPGLAKAMPKISNGGKTYTLFLRKGLKYSDGTPVKASDFPATVERLFKLNSGGSPFYTDIVGAEKFAETKSGGIPGIKANDKTGEIVINLTGPRGTFTNELAILFVAPVPQGTPAKDRLHRPAARHRALRDRQSRSRATAGPTNATRSGRRPTAKVMPEMPGGHVDKIEIERDPQRLDPGQRSRTGQDRLDADRAAARSLPGGQGQIRRHPVPGRADDQHLLLLDEHEAGAVRRPQGPPGGQLRGRPGRRWNGSTPASSPPPSRSCRPGCRATRSSTSTRTTWPRRSS